MVQSNITEDKQSSLTSLDVYLSIEKSKIERSAKFGGGDAEEI
ncbi:MAG: hypothetical protein ACJ70U_09075 [Nitrososphaera sp.]